jgi:hypothetical protein
MQPSARRSAKHTIREPVCILAMRCHGHDRLDALSPQQPTESINKGQKDMSP